MGLPQPVFDFESRDFSAKILLANAKLGKQARDDRKRCLFKKFFLEFLCLSEKKINHLLAVKRYEHRGIIRKINNFH